MSDQQNMRDFLARLAKLHVAITRPLSSAMGLSVAK